MRNFNSLLVCIHIRGFLGAFGGGGGGGGGGGVFLGHLPPPPPPPQENLCPPLSIYEGCIYIVNLAFLFQISTRHLHVYVYVGGRITPLSCIVICSGLGYDECVKKMRQLTLASLAAEQEVVPFSVLGEELRMEAAQLEHFIVDCK